MCRTEASASPVRLLDTDESAQGRPPALAPAPAQKRAAVSDAHWADLDAMMPGSIPRPGADAEFMASLRRSDGASRHAPGPPLAPHEASQLKFDAFGVRCAASPTALAVLFGLRGRSPPQCQPVVNLSPEPSLCP